MTGSAHPIRLQRFYVILHTPIGEEQRLVEAGIRLPALFDAGLVDDGPERLQEDVLARLYEEGARDKFFGAESPIE